MQYSLIPVTVTYTGTLEIPQLCPQNRADCMWEHADWYGTCTIGSPSSRENAFVLRYTTGVLSISPLKGFFPQFELVLSPVLLLAHVLLPLCVCSRDKDKVRCASCVLNTTCSLQFQMCQSYWTSLRGRSHLLLANKYMYIRGLSLTAASCHPTPPYPTRNLPYTRSKSVLYSIRCLGVLQLENKSYSSQMSNTAQWIQPWARGRLPREIIPTKIYVIC